ADSTRAREASRRHIGRRGVPLLPLPTQRLARPAPEPVRSALAPELLPLQRLRVALYAEPVTYLGNRVWVPVDARLCASIKWKQMGTALYDSRWPMGQASFAVRRANPRYAFFAEAEATLRDGTAVPAQVSELSSRGCY